MDVPNDDLSQRKCYLDELGSRWIVGRGGLSLAEGDLFQSASTRARHCAESHCVVSVRL